MILPYSIITNAIEEEALLQDDPWFTSKEEFEEWSGDVLDCIMFHVLDTLGIEYDTEK